MSEQDATTDVNPMDSLDFSTDEEAPIEPVETQETTTEDSSSEESKEEKTDPKEDTEATEDEAAKEGEESEEGDETEQEDESKPKNSANNRIRSLANENRQLKQEVERLNGQFYQPQTAEELQEQGMDETKAAVEALRQQQVMSEANNHITALNTDINMEALQVVQDYAVFNPDSKDYDEDFHNMVNRQWIQASGLTTDPNTNLITQARVLPYDFYKSFAEARELGEKKGAIKGRRDYEKTAQSTDVTPIASPKDEKKDTLMESLLAD